MARKITYYMDEHVAKVVIRGLCERGVDVLTVTEVGMLGATDEEHMQRAQAEGRVIFSQDTDFLRMHASGYEHSGIVYTSPYTPTRQIIQGLMLIYQLLDAEDMVSHVEYI